MKHVKLYVLKNYDGAEGFGNQPSGFIVEDKALAEKWTKDNVGASYNVVEGVIVDDFSQMEEAKRERDKQKALSKLTPYEKELLGIGSKYTPERLDQLKNKYVKGTQS